VFLGAFFTSIRNMISTTMQTGYDLGLAGTRSSESPSGDYEYEIRYVEILLILCELSLYLILWGWIYGII
jgi:hypothetical protein